MPYRKSQYKYKNKRRSRAVACPTPMWGKADKYVANKALWLAKKGLRMLNSEIKNHDVQLTNQAISTTSTISQLTNIAQGDTVSTRDGNQVKLISLDLKYTLVLNASATSTFVRVMIVHDSQTNQAIYTEGMLLDDVSGSDGIVSMLNRDNKFRFRVLYNKVHSLFAASAKGNSFTKVHKDLVLRIRFDASTPAIADLTSDSLSILYVSDQGTNTPVVTQFCRLKYVDN